MDPRRFSQVDGILEAVLDAPVEEWESLLDELCADDADLRREVERLLALDEKDSFLNQSPVAVARPDFVGGSDVVTLEAGAPGPAPQPEVAGSRIGAYEIIRPLGEGGMGAVYLARRHDGVHGQEVALKILATALQGLGVRERFHAEREILAHLSHPNIASLLDGGATVDGRPYLVMEWVDGVPIDRYCRREKLSFVARLELFNKVCAAVQEAHRSLIVHRDLKPANILVDSRGEPKLLDFGIAKLLSPETLSGSALVTATGNQPMTPAYASPEQVGGGPITTAVDVYALGILLHELLTGERPYSVSGVHLAEAIRRICSVVPPPPSGRIGMILEDQESSSGPRIEGLAETSGELRQLQRRLRGDLDSIVAMALRKERERRYPSAESLREDVERYLDGRPVKAAKDSWSYRVSKFVRRHKAGVATTVAVILFFLTFTVIIYRQGQQVREEQVRAARSSHFFRDLFVGVDPWSVETHNPSAAEMLDRGRRALEETPPGIDRVNLLHTIGTAYGGIGRYAEAEEMLRASLDERERLDLGDQAETAETMVHLSEVARWQGKLDEGLELVDSALEIFKDLNLAASREGVVAIVQRANSLDMLGEYSEAEASYRQAVGLAEEQGYSDLEAVALHRLGMAKRRLRLYDEALEVLAASLDAHLRTYGREHPRTAQALTELGTVRLALGEVEEARAALDGAETTLRRLLGEGHPELSRVLSRQGQLALALGDHDRAGKWLEQAETALRESLGDHTFLADTLRFKSVLTLYEGSPKEAETAAREALAIYKNLLGERHVNSADARHRLALAMAENGRTEEARKEIAGVVETLTDLTGESSPPTSFALADAGWIEVLAGDFAAAEEKLGRAIEALDGFYSHDHPDLAKLHNNLAIVKHGQGELDEAEAGYRSAMAICRETIGDAAPYYGALHTNLARLLENANRLDEAHDTLERGEDILDRAGLEAGHIWRLHADRIRAKIWLRQERYEAVDMLLRPWFERLSNDAAIGPSELWFTTDLLARNLEAWGRSAEAAELRRRLDGD